jgi:hypothetical protein
MRTRDAERGGASSVKRGGGCRDNRLCCGCCRSRRRGRSARIAGRADHGSHQDGQVCATGALAINLEDGRVHAEQRQGCR